MISLIKKIYNKRSILRYILHSIYFNFHYLPFNQAIHLPILLYKPHLKSMRGKIILDFGEKEIKFGSIKLGFLSALIYPDSGIMWENKGGTVIFKGNCLIGNDCYLSFSKNTTVEFGDEFRTNAGMKLLSYKGIKFGKYVRVGWGVLIMDTNLHPLYDLTKKKFKKVSGPIKIGDYNWFGTQCKIMHSVTTPERCIFGMNTIVTRGGIAKPYCVMGGSPIRILSENVIRDFDHDSEEAVEKYLSEIQQTDN